MVGNKAIEATAVMSVGQLRRLEIHGKDGFLKRIKSGRIIGVSLGSPLQANMYYYLPLDYFHAPSHLSEQPAQICLVCSFRAG